MSQASSRIHKRKEAKQIIASICEQRSNYLIIHYSCESFFNIPQGRTPRITSIAVMYFESSQTKSFSIHKVAEVQNVPFEVISDNYDRLEKLMLNEFYQFLKKHERYKWIHLNMRNINFGFEAIAHRYMALKGNPVEIEDNLKIDLGKLLVNLYGPDYIEHPRIETLCIKNGLTMVHFMTGEEEAIAFEQREYVKLHQSTLRKVENMHQIVDRAHEGVLKTNSNLIKLYGIRPQGLFQMMQENWLVSLIVFILGLVISKLI